MFIGDTEEVLPSLSVVALALYASLRPLLFLLDIPPPPESQELQFQPLLPPSSAATLLTFPLPLPDPEVT